MHGDDQHRGAFDSTAPLSGLDTLLAVSAATVTPDLDRHQRKGVPEVILALGKRPEDALAAARVFVERGGRALLSRVDSVLAERLRAAFTALMVEVYPISGMVSIKRPDFQQPRTDGRVAVITAGTSDVPIAEEAAIVAAEMGCQVIQAYDVGVAGLHRLAEPLRRALDARVDVIVVAAGMDGALPSVVAGLVDVPVIGLPTSIGYGAGGAGLAALLSMLQTCSPGLLVVNIDNGVGAGASAALIANRAAAARAGSGSSKQAPLV
jgi:NCAIR mutase (PurE)-related protein